MSERQQIHALVRGRVQGVGFRYFVERTAQSMGLVGEVRNLGDGRVELFAEGNPATLRQFIKKLEKGSSLSHVSAVDVQWAPATGAYSDFEITY